MDAVLSIGELTTLTGVPAETLRRWEHDYGLLRPSRTLGGQRRYSDDDVRRVNIVLDLSRQGWSRSDAARTVAEHGHAPQPPLDTSLFDALPLGVVVTDAAQRITYINPHLAALLETDLETLRGEYGFNHLDEAGQRQAVAAFARLSEGEQLEYDLPVRSTSGREFIVGVWAGPLFAPDGSYRGAAAMMADRTSHRAVEANLLLHARLLAAVGEAVVATDLIGRVLYWSPAAERQFGWRADEVIGRDVRELTPADVMSQLKGIGAEVMSIRECVRDVQLQRRDGTTLESKVTVSPLLDDGQITGFISVSVDITDRKQIEREARSRAAQQEVVAVLGQLALSDETETSVIEHAALAVAGTLDANFVSVLESPQAGDDLTVRFTIPASSSPAGRLSRPFRSHAVYTLRSQRPVVVEDFAQEQRFGRGPLAGERAARSGVCVPIPGLAQPAGVLCVHWTAARSISANDVSFLQSMASVIGLVVQRDRIEAELQRFTSA
jgi:PAS domain S-box-containing protein